MTHRTETASGPEIIFVIVLCLLAGARVFIFSAAFPFFNNIDEQMHFDLVYKYSVGHVPDKEIEDYNRRTAELILLYGTPEYFNRPASFPNGRIPPPAWKVPNVRSSEEFQRAVSHWRKEGNHESGSFPLYYALAGLWAAAGRRLGLSGGYFLYWIRFLNVPLIAMLVGLSWLVGRNLAEDNPVQRLGLPIMTAFFPQDLFYAINNDVLSPLLFALAFFMLFQLYFEKRSLLYHAVTGSAVAGCFLVKASNLPVLLLLGVIVALKIRRLRSEARLAKHLPRLCVLTLSALVPTGLWLARNMLVFGDLTGAAHKAAYLGWSVKPPGQLLNHPIFTPAGLLTFLKGVTVTFWRGEFVWHLRPIASSCMDAFYLASTAIFIGISLGALLLKPAGTSRRTRFLLTMSFLTAASSVLLLAALSVAYDFGDCWFPSRNSPYFLAGRLISCSLLPFLILYIDGLGRFFSRVGKPLVPLGALSAIALAMTVSEWMITRPVFASAYNWFHL